MARSGPLHHELLRQFALMMRAHYRLIRDEIMHMEAPPSQETLEEMDTLDKEFEELIRFLNRLTSDESSSSPS